MKQTPEEQSTQPATARAEALLGSLGRRLDQFTAQAGQRIHDAAVTIREEADKMDQPSTADGEKAQASGAAQAEEKSRQAMEEAEQLVDRLGNFLGRYLAMGAFQVKRSAARLREEGEDMLAEAQHMRRQRARPPR